MRRHHAPPVAISAVVLLAVAVAACGRGNEPSVAEEAAAAAVRGVDRARHERTLNRLEQFRTALARYAIDHEGSLPEGSSLAGITTQLSPRYLPLMEPQDAWGGVMSYSSDGRTYAIVSAGPDGRMGSGDDVTLRDGAIAGAATLAP